MLVLSRLTNLGLATDAMIEARERINRAPPFMKVGLPPKLPLGDTIHSVEFEINNVPASARNLLTKGVIQDEISAFSGAAVSTRGRYLSSEESSRSCRDRALYLFIQGASKTSVDLAVERIEQVVMNHTLQNGPPPSQPRQSRFKMGPPPTNLPPPSILSSQFTSVPPPMINLPSQLQNTLIMEKVLTGMDNAPSTFDLRNKLLGVGGANLQYMRNETGAMVTLRGKGSGFIEPSSGMESHEPLHFHIEHPRLEGVREARTLAINLIETLQQELQQQQQQQQQQQHQQQQHQQQQHLLAFQQGALQTVQLGSVGQTGLLALPPEMLQQAGLVTASIGNINVPTILTQQHVGPLVVPPPPIGVPPPNIVQPQQLQQQQLIQAQVQLPPPGVHIPTHQGPLVPPLQQPQQVSQQHMVHQVHHQFQLAPTNQQPSQIQQHMLAQPPPPIQQVLLSQAPPTSQSQTQVLGLFQQPPPQSPQQSQQQPLYVQAGLPLIHQPPPMVNAQLQFQHATQQQQQQILSVPPPPPPPPQQVPQSQAGQQVQANFISQSVPMQYTLQFQQMNTSNSPAPPHQAMLDHSQAQQVQQPPHSQSSQILQNQGGFVQMTGQGVVQPTSGSQSLVQVPPPVMHQHHGVLGPPQASVAVPMPVPAPGQVSQASFQHQSMPQPHMQLQQLQQSVQYQLPPGNQSPMHGQTAPHGPTSPAMQQRQQELKSPNRQEGNQGNRQGTPQQTNQQQKDRRPSPQPHQRQGIGIEELIQMNHQQRQQLSVQPGSAQNGPQGQAPDRAPRDQAVMQQSSSAIGQDKWSEGSGNSNKDPQTQGKGEKNGDERDGKISGGIYEDDELRDFGRDRERERERDRRETRDANGRPDYGGPFGRGRSNRSEDRDRERERERERDHERERERDRERERPTYNHYQSKPQLYNPSLPIHMQGPPPPPPPGPGPSSSPSGPGQQQQQQQQQQSGQSQGYPQYYQGWGLNPYACNAWMGQ